MVLDPVERIAGRALGQIIFIGIVRQPAQERADITGPRLCRPERLGGIEHQGTIDLDILLPQGMRNLQPGKRIKGRIDGGIAPDGNLDDHIIPPRGQLLRLFNHPLLRQLDQFQIHRMRGHQLNQLFGHLLGLLPAFGPSLLHQRRIGRHAADYAGLIEGFDLGYCGGIGKDPGRPGRRVREFLTTAGMGFGHTNPTAVSPGFGLIYIEHNIILSYQRTNNAICLSSLRKNGV
ncbi:MAG: hypothetical protein BWY71_01984 [Planctomycetes bacterium ADurb.Bin412]|nr:MAG: hypothetical protein BWY71_01984 [Planctomycetes bacterium ADurb.Bin412]